jgi:predicted dehydrogenase
MKTYTCALVGCGAISKKHIEAFSANAASMQLVAVCDVDGKRAEAAAAAYKEKVLSAPWLRAYTDHRRMLEAEKPDVVAIATSSSFHYGIAMDALHTGAHIIVEKPIALSTREADGIIALARNKKLKIAVCYITRFDKHILALKDAIEAGRFGRIFSAALQVNWNRNDEYYRQAPWRGTWDKDGGTLMNQCAHGIDLLQWALGGRMVRVYGVLRRYLRPIEAEDFGSAIVEFAGGAVGVLQGTVNVYPSNLDETLSVFGEKGTVVIGGKAMNEVKTWKFAGTPEAEEPGIIAGLNKNGGLSGHAALYLDFAESIAEGRQPMVNGEEGKKSVDLVLGIYKSMKTGGPVAAPIEHECLSMRNSF